MTAILLTVAITIGVVLFLLLVGSAGFLAFRLMRRLEILSDRFADLSKSNAQSMSALESASKSLSELAKYMEAVPKLIQSQRDGILAMDKTFREFKALMFRSGGGIPDDEAAAERELKIQRVMEMSNGEIDREGAESRVDNDEMWRGLGNNLRAEMGGGR